MVVAASCLAILLGFLWIWAQVRDVHEIFPPEEDDE